MSYAYFDHNATTPLDPRVLEAMLPWLGGRYGNASSVHAYGQAAREAVEEARSRVAELLGIPPPELVFGASGTELNNAVLFSAAHGGDAATPCSGHFVVSAFEHPSVLKAAARLEALGCPVTRVAPGADGVVRADAIEAALTPETRLVAVMLANNEVGTVQPIAEIAAVCSERAVPVLADAVQAVGKIRVSCRDLGADYLTIGAHKFHGPLGTAALRIRGERRSFPTSSAGVRSEAAARARRTYRGSSVSGAPPSWRRRSGRSAAGGWPPCGIASRWGSSRSATSDCTARRSSGFRTLRTSPSTVSRRSP